MGRLLAWLIIIVKLPFTRYAILLVIDCKGYLTRTKLGLAFYNINRHPISKRIKLVESFKMHDSQSTTKAFNVPQILVVAFEFTGAARGFSHDL